MQALLVFLLAAGAATSAEPPPADLLQPALIHIDAVASDATGRPVENLAREDFDVLVDGAAQPIDGVRFVRAGAGATPATGAPIVTRADEQAAASEDGARLFAIFLDEYHVTDGRGVAQARYVLARFVADVLGPRDLVVVVKPLDSLLTLRMTRDRDAINAAIAGFEGRKGLYDARNEFERSLIAGTPARIEAVRSQIATSALNALAAHLGTLGAARKMIILVSEGFSRGQRRRGDEALPSIDTAIRTASRARVSIYPFDPTASPEAGSSPGRATLRTLAEETDGRPILDEAEPSAVLAQIVAMQAAYYLISFRAPSQAADGRFHHVDVRVRRPDTEVRASKGYWAPSPEDILRARLLARASEPGPVPEPPRHISALIRPWFGIARGRAGLTEVNFVWEPAARVPGDRARPATPARLRLQVFRPDGSGLFDGVVSPSGNGGPMFGGERARVSFETLPGRLKLRMAIEDAAARVIDTDVRDLIVGPMTAPVVIGTPEILRARTARDLRVLVADAQAVPVAAREFSRTERLLIRAPAYAPGEAPSVSATLASRQGGAMRELNVEPGPQLDYFQIDLPLAGLAAGEYAVKITAKSAAGEAADEIAFRVTP
jgi:VWFA-related protein